MDTLTEDQLSSAKGFIDSLPDSIVKGNYERWLTEANKNSISPKYDLEKFVALAGALPKEFQSFPQNFAQSVKNGGVPEATDEVVEIKEKGDTKKAAIPKKKKK